MTVSVVRVEVSDDGAREVTITLRDSWAALKPSVDSLPADVRAALLAWLGAEAPSQAEAASPADEGEPYRGEHGGGAQIEISTEPDDVAARQRGGSLGPGFIPR